MLGTSLWFIPSLFMAGAAAAALSLGGLDRVLAKDYANRQILLAFSGGPDAARALLAAVGGSILTLAALVFSITVLVLQLTSTQYSPRALRTFMRDRTSKVTMGVFLGTFVFVLLGLREVRTETAAGAEFVPGMLVTGALLLTLVSLYMFIFYIHHISRSIQASSIIAAIAHESAETLERLYRDEFGPQSRIARPVVFEGDPVEVIVARSADTVVTVDTPSLVRLAQDHDACLELTPGLGEFIVTGQMVFKVYGNPIPDHESALRHVRLGDHRTMEQDLRFGFRQLVDIAIRALSASTNDPSTAIQSLDRLHDLLRRLGQREFPTHSHEDDGGTVRLSMNPQSWESFVRDAVEEIAYYAADTPAVSRRLQRMYDDLMENLPPERAAVVRRVATETGWV